MPKEPTPIFILDSQNYSSFNPAQPAQLQDTAVSHRPTDLELCLYRRINDLEVCNLIVVDGLSENELLYTVAPGIGSTDDEPRRGDTSISRPVG